MLRAPIAADSRSHTMDASSRRRWARCVDTVARLCPRLEALVVRNCQHALARELVQALLGAVCAPDYGPTRRLESLRQINLEGCSSSSAALDAALDPFILLPSLERLELAHAVFVRDKSSPHVVS